MLYSFVSWPTTNAGTAHELVNQLGQFGCQLLLFLHCRPCQCADNNLCRFKICPMEAAPDMVSEHSLHKSQFAITRTRYRIASCKKLTQRRGLQGSIVGKDSFASYSLEAIFYRSRESAGSLAWSAFLPHSWHTRTGLVVTILPAEYGQNQTGLLSAVDTLIPRPDCKILPCSPHLLTRPF